MKYKIRIKNPIIGVPITFMNVCSLEQFEIVGADEAEGTGFSNGLFIEGSKYKQCFIKLRCFTTTPAEEMHYD